MTALVAHAIRRMWRLLPVQLPAPGTVAAADLRTSVNDARAALTIALGKHPDVDGWPLPDVLPAAQLEMFEVTA